MNAIDEKIIIMKKIIDILISNEGEDDLSRISQKKIAKQIDRSRSCVSQTIRTYKHVYRGYTDGARLYL